MAAKVLVDSQGGEEVLCPLDDHQLGYLVSVGGGVETAGLGAQPWGVIGFRPDSRAICLPGSPLCIPLTCSNPGTDMAQAGTSWRKVDLTTTSKQPIPAWPQLGPTEAPAPAPGSHFFQTAWALEDRYP